MIRALRPQLSLYEPAPKKQTGMTTRIRKIKLPERDIQVGIVELLEYLDILHSVTDASNVFGPDGQPRKRKSNIRVGWPDTTAAVLGYLLCLETKTSSGHLSRDQRHVRDAVLADGGFYFVVRSDIEALRAVRSVFRAVLLRLSGDELVARLPRIEALERKLRTWENAFGGVDGMRPRAEMIINQPKGTQ